MPLLLKQVYEHAGSEEEKEQRRKNLTLFEHSNIQVLQERGTLDRPDIIKDVLILNAMPKKPHAERDFLMCLGNGQHIIRPTFINVDVTTGIDHGSISISKFELEKAKEKNFVGTITTGAALGFVPYENLEGLEDFNAAIDWATDNTGGVFNVCWGAIARLNHEYGIAKNVADEKIIGIFNMTAQNRQSQHNLVKHWPANIGIPTARMSFIKDTDIHAISNLEVLATTPDMRSDSQIAMLYDESRNAYYMLNHPEYGGRAIELEYKRDRANPQGGRPTPEPHGDYIMQSKTAPWLYAAQNIFNPWINRNIAKMEQEKTPDAQNDNTPDVSVVPYDPLTVNL